MKESDIIRELEQAIAAAESPEDAYTTTELSEMLELNVKQVRKRLRALMKAGRLEHVKVMRSNALNGVMAPRDAYRILPAEAA